MGKFIIGLFIGVALAFAYVRWGISAPAIVDLPDKLRGNIVSSTVEGELYDLSKPLVVRLKHLHPRAAPTFANVSVTRTTS